MNALPFGKELVAPLDNLRVQPAHVGPLDASHLNHLRLPVRSEQVDLRQPRSDDVDVGGLVVVGIDHEPKAVGAVNDNRALV